MQFVVVLFIKKISVLEPVIVSPSSQNLAIAICYEPVPTWKLCSLTHCRRNRTADCRRLFGSVVVCCVNDLFMLMRLILVNYPRICGRTEYKHDKHQYGRFSGRDSNWDLPNTMQDRDIWCTEASNRCDQNQSVDSALSTCGSCEHWAARWSRNRPGEF
jgi:hypothetical protein